MKEKEEHILQWDRWGFFMNGTERCGKWLKAQRWAMKQMNSSPPQEILIVTEILTPVSFPPQML